MAVWDPYVPEADRAQMGKEWGNSRGFGVKPALLIVDMSYSFVDDRYPMGYGETGWPCVAAIRRLLDQAREQKLPVLYTTGLPNRNPAERGLWKAPVRTISPDLPDPREIVPQLEPLPSETVIRKRRPSAFFSTELTSLLIYDRVDTVIVTGMVTSGCIRATVVDAFSNNFRVIVPEECVADRSQVSHAINLFDMHMKYGDVMPLEEVLATLKGMATA